MLCMKMKPFDCGVSVGLSDAAVILTSFFLWHLLAIWRSQSAHVNDDARYMHSRTCLPQSKNIGPLFVTQLTAKALRRHSFMDRFNAVYENEAIRLRGKCRPIGCSCDFNQFFSLALACDMAVAICSR